MINRVVLTGKRIFLLSLITGLIIVPGLAQSQIKVAIINSQKAFDESVEGQKAVAILQEREEQMKSQLKKLDDEIKKLKDRLTNQRLTLSPEAQSQLQREIDQKEAARLKYEQESSRDFEHFKNQLIKRIRDEMLAIIDDLIKERDYELVFDLTGSGLIHYKPELDITDEVIKLYNLSKAIKR